MNRPLSLPPNGHQPTSPSVEHVFDSSGQSVGVLIDGVFHGFSASQTSTSPKPVDSGADPMAGTDLFRQAARVLVQSELDTAEERVYRRDQRRREVQREYEGEILGEVRGNLTNFRDSLTYHRERREEHQQQMQTWRDLAEARNAHLMNIVTTQAALQRLEGERQLQAYQREIYEHEVLFEDRRSLLPRREERSHELALDKQAGEREIELKKLKLDAMMAQRRLDSDDKDKDRVHDLDKKVFEMARQLPEVLYELRLLEEDHPDAMLEATIGLVQDTMTSFGNVGNLMSKEDRATYAPILERTFNEAWKAIRRRRRGDDPGVGAKIK